MEVKKHMARIAGVDLPREKRVEIGLTYMGYDFVWEDLLRETLSVKALRLCQIPPFVTYGDIFPRCGGSLPSQGELLRISYGQR